MPETDNLWSRTAAIYDLVYACLSLLHVIREPSNFVTLWKNSIQRVRPCHPPQPGSFAVAGTCNISYRARDAPDYSQSLTFLRLDFMLGQYRAGRSA